MAEVVSCLFVWGFLLFIMRFTDKTTLTLTGTFFVPFRHVTSSIPSSIVQPCLCNSVRINTRFSNPWSFCEISNGYYVCLSVCGSRMFSESRGTCFKPRRTFTKTLNACISWSKQSRLCQAVTVRCNVVMNWKKICQPTFLVCLALAIHNKGKQMGTKRPQPVTNNQLSLYAIKKSVVFRFYWLVLKFYWK